MAVPTGGYSKHGYDERMYYKDSLMHIRCTEAVNHFALLAVPDFLGFERRSLGRRRRSLPIHHPYIVTSVLSA